MKLHFLEENYSKAENNSIDYAILEKADNVFVLPSSFGWSDLGTWKSVHEQLEEKDSNTALNVNLHAINSEKNLVVSDTKKLVVIKDLNGYFIIDTKDALLICKSDQEQEVKKISSDIRKKFKGKYS